MNELPSTGRILIVGDAAEKRAAQKAFLEAHGHRVVAVAAPRAALDLVAGEDFDVVLTDVGMSEMSGLELCQRVLGVRPGLAVIALSGEGTMEMVVLAMRHGAFDFLVEPIEPKLFLLRVSRAVEHHRLKDEVKRLRAPSGASARGALIGDSPAMRRVYDLIDRLGSSEPSVLICGESGTGKELVARAIHAASRRRAGPFVAINCAAVPASLIESELFGHARGAFTDAKTARTGVFSQADGGTLFLDEIGEMPLAMQSKLLRALQERVVRPVGGNDEVRFDTRLISATNRDLENEVGEKRFREDLYYRINVVALLLPLLCERGNDVLLLAQHFLDKYASRGGKLRLALSPQVAQKLLAYDWPGNVRELENSVERMIALARFEELTIEDLPERVRGYRPDHFVLAADSADQVLPLDEVERRYIDRVLKLVEGNKTRAAELLGLDRRTLHRKLARFEAADKPS